MDIYLFVTLSSKNYRTGSNKITETILMKLTQVAEDPKYNRILCIPAFLRDQKLNSQNCVNTSISILFCGFGNKMIHILLYKDFQRKTTRFFYFIFSKTKQYYTNLTMTIATTKKIKKQFEHFQGFPNIRKMILIHIEYQKTYKMLLLLHKKLQKRVC